MPTVRHNKDALKLLKELPRTGLVGGRKLHPLLTKIVAMLPLTLSVEGMEASEITGGIHLAAGAGSGGTTTVTEITMSPLAGPFAPGVDLTFTAEGWDGGAMEWMVNGAGQGEGLGTFIYRTRADHVIGPDYTGLGIIRVSLAYPTTSGVAILVKSFTATVS